MKKKEASREEIEEAKRILRRFQDNGRFRVKRRRLYVYNDSLGTSYNVFIKDIARKIIKEWRCYIKKDILERTCVFDWIIGSISEKQNDKDDNNKAYNRMKKCRTAMLEAKSKRQKEKYEKLQKQYDKLWELIDVGSVGVLAEDAWHKEHDKFYF